MSVVNIVFVIHSMHSGGSERVMLHLLRNLSRERFSITLILLDRQGALLQFLPNDIAVISFRFKRTISAIFQLHRVLRRLKPAIVFSTLNQVNLMISLIIPLLPANVVFIARESSIASKNNKNFRYPVIFEFLYKTTFRRFDAIICQSISMKDDLLRNFAVEEAKVTVINNPVDFRLFHEIKEEKRQSGELRLISVGQLRKEKGYDRLLKALACCNVSFHYRIIGDGAIQRELVNLVDDLGLTGKVEFMGEIPNPYGYMSQSDLFLQGSYYEGFPNAMIEANACGIPVVAWKAPGGHNEIIVEGINGWVVDSEKELCGLMGSTKIFDVNKRTIVEMTRSRFDLKKIVSLYEQRFISALKKESIA